MGRAQYPSSSPWVVSAGGTTVNRDASGNFVSESCWSGSRGGVSAYEKWQSPPNILNGMGPWAAYQFPFAGQGARQTPDLAFDSDPASGVNVYAFGYGGWVIVSEYQCRFAVVGWYRQQRQQSVGSGPAGQYPLQPTGKQFDLFAAVFEPGVPNQLL